MSTYFATILPVFDSSSKALLELNAKSVSKSSIDPVAANKFPTGTVPFPRSDIVFVMENVEVLSVRSRTNLGESSIRSKVHSGLFIVCATTLRPRIRSISLY